MFQTILHQAIGASMTQSCKLACKDAWQADLQGSLAKSKIRQLLWNQKDQRRPIGSTVLNTTMPMRSRMAGNDGTRMVVAI